LHTQATAGFGTKSGLILKNLFIVCGGGTVWRLRTIGNTYSLRRRLAKVQERLNTILFVLFSPFSLHPLWAFARAQRGMDKTYIERVVKNGQASVKPGSNGVDRTLDAYGTQFECPHAMR
jgi:hypothetical protein